LLARACRVIQVRSLGVRRALDLSRAIIYTERALKVQKT